MILAQVGQHMLSEDEALSSNPVLPKKGIYSFQYHKGIIYFKIIQMKAAKDKNNVIHGKTES
jgi:hypothetical protein